LVTISRRKFSRGNRSQSLPYALAGQLGVGQSTDATLAEHLARPTSWHLRAAGEAAGVQKMLEFGGGQWLAEQKTLHVVTLKLAQQLPLGLGFHALDQDAQPKAVGDTGNGVND
jgi:hypothetical protein